MRWTIPTGIRMGQSYHAMRTTALARELWIVKDVERRCREHGGHAFDFDTQTCRLCAIGYEDLRDAGIAP